MIEIGDSFNVKGKNGIVCFKGNYYDQDYILIAFEEDSSFGIYKYKFEVNKHLVAEETDKEKYAYVLSEFVTDEVADEGQLDWLIDALNEAEANKQSN